MNWGSRGEGNSQSNGQRGQHDRSLLLFVSIIDSLVEREIHHEEGRMTKEKPMALAPWLTVCCDQGNCFTIRMI